MLIMLLLLSGEVHAKTVSDVIHSNLDQCIKYMNQWVEELNNRKDDSEDDDEGK